jgi:hypothetical protein
MWFWENQSLLLLLNTEKMQIMPKTNFIVFCLTWQGLDSTIYHTRGEHASLTWQGLDSTIYHTQGEHASHYTTDVYDILYDMAGSQTLLWQQVKKSCISKITSKTSKA